MLTGSAYTYLWELSVLYRANWQCIHLPVARNDEVEHQGQSDEACWGVGKSGGMSPTKNPSLFWGHLFVASHSRWLGKDSDSHAIANELVGQMSGHHGVCAYLGCKLANLTSMYWLSYTVNAVNWEKIAVKIFCWPVLTSHFLVFTYYTDKYSHGWI